jgi:elongation factor G
MHVPTRRTSLGPRRGTFRAFSRERDRRSTCMPGSVRPGQRAALQALVPLAEISEYQLRLKALTGGEGAYAMELSHYDPVSPRRQQQLVQAWRSRSDSD